MMIRKAFRQRTRLILFLFALAVLIPSTVLSFLALRAAERESLYIERNLEASLFAEVDLAVTGVTERLARITENLALQANKVDDGTITPSEWTVANQMVGSVFTLQDEHITLYNPPGRSFNDMFREFLLGNRQLPVYDSIVSVYRREIREVAQAREQTAAPRPLQSGSAPMESSELDALPPSSLPPPEMEAIAPKKPTGIEKQMAQSELTADPEVLDRAFSLAEDEGFELMQRNVAPSLSKAAPSPAVEQKEESKPERRRIADERSETVSRGRYFTEISQESESGILPLEDVNGMELLFWQKTGTTVTGCTIRMESLANEIADALPDVLTPLRVLMVLDEAANPLFTPSMPTVPDWRRPFVARELSSALPRWEIGAWLTDPGMMERRAKATETAVWILVASLFVIITVGGFTVLYLLTAEIRLAGRKTSFVANVSHELKTPLTSIKLFAELLLSGRQTDDRKRAEYLKTMVSETDRLSHLVDNVLSFSKRDVEKYPMQQLALSDLVAEICDQMRPHLSRNGFVLDCRIDENVSVTGNREALRQIVMNLLSNAEKYSGQNREIVVRCRIEGRDALVEVMDRGIGIAPQNADRIFEEFFRADDSLASAKSGTGLGLSIAKSIAKAHGGSVRYRPREGGGSVFSLILPRAETAKEEDN